MIISVFILLSDIGTLSPQDSSVYLMWLYQIGHVKWKSAFEHGQNVQIQIILHMCKVSSEPLLSIHTFCSIQWSLKWRPWSDYADAQADLGLH